MPAACPLHVCIALPRRYTTLLEIVCIPGLLGWFGAVDEGRTRHVSWPILNLVSMLLLQGLSCAYFHRQARGL